MVTRVEDVVGEGVAAPRGSDKDFLVGGVVGHVDAFGIVEVHFVGEVRTVDRNAVGRGGAVAGAACAATQEGEQAGKEE